MKPPALDRRGDDRLDPDKLSEHRCSAGATVLQVDPSGRFESCRSPLEDDVFLGVGASGPWFARHVDQVSGPTLRDGDDLSDELREAAVAAVAVLTWHDQSPRCERCHQATRSAAGGFSRICIACGHQIFPRTDPAIIVALVDDDDRLLLAHQVVWPERRASLLAGFAEAGESAEHTVIREVREESGLLVSALRYLVSQPWPFPRSLMLAYVARANGEPVVDQVEIEWARWYTRVELEQDVLAGELLLPGSGSVAARVIDLWRNGGLPRPEDAPVL